MVTPEGPELSLPVRVVAVLWIAVAFWSVGLALAVHAIW